MTRTQKLLAMFAATALCSPVLAQGSGKNQERNNQRDQDRASERQGQQSPSQNPSQRQGQQRSSSSQGQTLDWESTTVIGYDLNGDGIADAYYAASRYELDQMRRKAMDQRRQMTSNDRQRMQRETQSARSNVRSFQNQGQGQSQGQMQRPGSNDRTMDRGQRGGQRPGQGFNQRPDQRSGQGSGQGSNMDSNEGSNWDSNQGSNQGSDRSSGAMNSTRMVTGTIRDMKEFNLTGMNGKRSIARVETENGNHVAVILGATDKMGEMDLRKGDKVTLRVNQGSIDGRNVLVADRVRLGNESFQVENRKVDNLKRISGDIVSARKQDLSPGNGDPAEHQLIKVKESNGRTCVVSLGPISQTDQMRLKKGEQVSVLASPSKVNGHMIYCARKVSHNGQTKNLASAGSGSDSGSDRRASGTSRARK